MRATAVRRKLMKLTTFTFFYSSKAFAVSHSKAFVALWYAHLWDMMLEEDDLQKK
jgi:hypothetical protein